MKRAKRWMAGLLSAVLLASLLSATAMAADADPVTRAVLAEMIYDQFYKDQTADDQGFTDIGPVEDGAEDPCTDAQRTAINVLVAEGVLSGSSDGEFHPHGEVTRAQVAVTLWRATGCKSNPTASTVTFTDVHSGDWYAPAIQALSAAGVFSGSSDGKFNPTGTITEAQLTSLMNKVASVSFAGFANGVTRLEMVMEAYEKYKDSPLAENLSGSFSSSFTDIGTCSSREQTAIAFFEELGIVQGFNETPPAFHPDAAASNLQAAAFLQRCATMFEADETEDMQSLWEEDGLLTMQEVSYADPRAQQTPAEFFESLGLSASAAAALAENPDAPATSANLSAFTDAVQAPAEPEIGMEDDLVAITCAAADAVIYYTMDGSEPTVNSTPYTGAISATENTTIKAVAVKNSLYSEIAEYTVGGGSDPVGWTYPIYIIGPTGEMDSYVDLDGNGEVYLIQGSGTILYDPHDNPDTAIQNQLKYWVYKGWVFTAEKDGETETYGPTKYVDDDLRAFLNPLIAQGWELTMNSRDCGEWVGCYPITIIGPTGEMDSYVDLDGKGEVSLIQGSDTTLYDPHDNPDTAIQNQLKYWVYKGWVFTAEKDGETKTYGPTKYVDDSLKAFLNPLIADNWTLTMNSKSCGYYDYPDSGSSGGSSSSGSSGNKTETTTNPDGSTTTTVTSSNGTITETTKNPDGSKEVVETKKDGTVTTTTTDSVGNETKVVEKADGSAETTVSNIDGSSSVTTVREDGTVEASVNLPAKVIEDAVDSDAVVALPMPAVPATADASAAASVTVALPAGRSARVEIPVENVTAGIVAVLVKADGTEQVVKTSTVTENGVAVTVSDGDTVKIVDNSKDFTDVSSTYWAADAIAFATSHELFAGTTTTTFTPGAPMTRVMIVTVLARYASDDSSLVIGYAEGQQWAVETGISDGSNMSGTVTRQQMAAMLYRYAGSPAVTGSLAGFPDAASVSDYATDAMIWAVENGFITGMTDGTLNPYGLATRAQVATILQRFVEATVS
jgi:hypothetical protein